MRVKCFAFVECAESIKIVLYMAPLRVVPSHYRFVSVVHMRREMLDKSQNGEYACNARSSDDTYVPLSVHIQLPGGNAESVGCLQQRFIHLGVLANFRDH